MHHQYKKNTRQTRPPQNTNGGETVGGGRAGGGTRLDGKHLSIQPSNRNPHGERQLAAGDVVAPDRLGDGLRAVDAGHPDL